MSYPDYDSFAWFYDRYWSERYHRSAAPVLDRLLLANIGPGSKVLDLCCGSGHLSKWLVERGLDVRELTGRRNC